MILLSEQKYDQQNRYLETRKNIYVVSALSFTWSIREKQNTDEQKLLLTAVYIQTKRQVTLNAIFTVKPTTLLAPNNKV